VNKTFKPERQKIQMLITWKLLSRSRRNFTGSTHHEYAFVGDPMALSTNPRWRRPPSL